MEGGRWLAATVSWGRGPLQQGRGKQGWKTRRKESGNPFVVLFLQTKNKKREREREREKQPPPSRGTMWRVKTHTRSGLHIKRRFRRPFPLSSASISPPAWASSRRASQPRPAVTSPSASPHAHTTPRISPMCWRRLFLYFSRGRNTLTWKNTPRRETPARLGPFAICLSSLWFSQELLPHLWEGFPAVTSFCVISAESFWHPHAGHCLWVEGDQACISLPLVKKPFFLGWNSKQST